MKKIFFTSLSTVLLAVTFIYAGQMINGWDITTDNSGTIQSMSYQNPHSYLNIESLITIKVDYQGVPVKGTVKFRDGVERELNMPAEAMAYWNDLLGPSTFWDFMKSQNKVTSIDPSSGPLPSTCYGKMSRVIIKDGREYIGKLSENAINSDWFYINTQGSSVTVYRLVVREIQQL